MVKQEFPKKAKLTNCIIGNLRSSSAFLAKYAYSDISLHDHVDIIRTISNCKCQFSHIFHKFNYFCLLTRCHSAKNSGFAFINYILQILLVLYERNSRPIYYWAKQVFLQSKLVVSYNILEILKVFYSSDQISLVNKFT